MAPTLRLQYAVFVGPVLQAKAASVGTNPRRRYARFGTDSNDRYNLSGRLGAATTTISAQDPHHQVAIRLCHPDERTIGDVRHDRPAGKRERPHHAILVPVVPASSRDVLRRGPTPPPRDRLLLRKRHSALRLPAVLDAFERKPQSPFLADGGSRNRREQFYVLRQRRAIDQREKFSAERRASGRDDVRKGGKAGGVRAPERAGVRAGSPGIGNRVLDPPVRTGGGIGRRRPGFGFGSRIPAERRRNPGAGEEILRELSAPRPAKGFVVDESQRQQRQHHQRPRSHLDDRLAQHARPPRRDRSDAVGALQRLRHRSGEPSYDGLAVHLRRYR
mmetsp:Transcript_22274/g.52955  ORF Transcript_22274/g.52955 Transcript_22274/m.52955 type:complete len:332 (+) Transcript_22274:817-1812(+)